MPTQRPAYAERGKVRSGCLIAVVAAVVVVVVASYGLFRYGSGLIEDEVRQDLSGNAVLREHLGSIEELSLDLVASGNLDGEDDLAFRVRGSQGRGTLSATVLTGEDDLEHVVRGTLTLESGLTVDLFPDAELAPPSAD